MPSVEMPSTTHLRPLTKCKVFRGPLRKSWRYAWSQSIEDPSSPGFNNQSRNQYRLDIRYHISIFKNQYGSNQYEFNDQFSKACFLPKLYLHFIHLFHTASSGSFRRVHDHRGGCGASVSVWTKSLGPWPQNWLWKPFGFKQPWGWELLELLHDIWRYFISH